MATQAHRDGRLVAWLVVIGALVVASVGWQRTWFLTDDAFIAFRYVGNAHAGHGLVWNEPPFLPVEGYSSLLWVLCLWAIWAVAGFDPPQSCNWLSLLCGLCTVLLVARAAIRSAAAAFGRCGLVVVGVALLTLALNRTFVTWLSSGLETAMFGLFAVWWTLLAARTPTRADRRFLAGLALTAALATLTRPDGMLFVLATLLLAASSVKQVGLVGVAASMLPLLLPAAHFAWRRMFHGEWLPNTYYAKVVAAWPESGVRYLYCFALEHGTWLWLVLVAWYLATRIRPLPSLPQRLVAARGVIVAVGTWLGYVGYYVLVVGGDYFEYRPFAPLVPLCLVAAVTALSSLGRRWWIASAWMLVLGVATDGFGLFLDGELQASRERWFTTVASRVPAPVRPVFRAWERDSAWLWLHLVGVRREFHAAFCAGKVEGFPVRDFTLVGPPGDRAILAVGSAGVIPWSLPNVSVLDVGGLNDWVIARTACPVVVPAPEAALQSTFALFDVDHGERLDATELAAAVRLARAGSTDRDVHNHVEALRILCDEQGDGLDRVEYLVAARTLEFPRQMAHERRAPPGYLEAFRPNVTVADGALRIVPRAVPLTDAEIVRIEQLWRADRR